MGPLSFAASGLSRELPVWIILFLSQLSPVPVVRPVVPVVPLVVQFPLLVPYPAEQFPELNFQMREFLQVLCHYQHSKFANLVFRGESVGKLAESSIDVSQNLQC